MFLGMRSTSDWAPDQRPLNWNQQYFKMYPNGTASLTALLSMMRSERVDDPQFHWWTQEQTAVSGAVTGVFTVASLATPYVNGAIAGQVLYVRISAADGERVRVGHQILLRKATDYRVDVVGKIISVTRGTDTILAVKLLENDDNSPSNDLSDCDNFKIIGNINPEGGEMPEAIALNPVKIFNYTQIFRTPLSITRTARKGRLRTPDQYQKAKAEALEIHSWEKELAFFLGIRTENPGSNGKPERTTMGVINFIRQYAPLNCDDYTLNPAYAGQTWAVGGELWLKKMLEQIFRYGAEDKLCLCGSGFLLAIDALAQQGGQVNIQPGQKIYGMQIREWLTPFGTIYMKTHPLFSHDATTRNMAVILEPKELTYKYIDDTTFYGEAPNKQHPEGYGARRIDGTNEEFLTECGLEFGLPQKCGILNGAGLKNNLV